jgi:hypothetical protein
MSNALELTYFLYSMDLTTPNMIGRGEIRDLHSRKIMRRRNLPTTAEIVMDIDHPLAQYLDPNATFPPMLKVYRNRTDIERAASSPTVSHQVCFAGYLLPENVHDDTATGETTAVFGDPRQGAAYWYFNQNVYYTAQPQAGIPADMFFQMYVRGGAPLQISVGGVIGSGTPRDRHYVPGQNIAQLITELCGVIGGPTVDFRPSDATGNPFAPGYLDCAVALGSDKPTVRFIHGPDWSTNCDVEHYYTPATTYVTEVGIDSAGNQQIQVAGLPGTSPLGLLEQYNTESDISETATLLEKAQGIIAQFFTAPDVWQVKNCSREAPLPFVDFDLDDGVYLNVDRGRLQAANVKLRVDGFDVSVDDEGTVNIDQLILVTF